MDGKTIILEVTRNCTLKRLKWSRLVRCGYILLVIMTNSATVCSSLTFQTLSAAGGDGCLLRLKTGMWLMLLMLRRNLIVIAPATANVLAKPGSGFGDDMPTATVLASRAPVL